MHNKKTINAALIFGFVLIAVAGCQKEGPAERAGKEIDNTVKKLTQRVELPALRADTLRVGTGAQNR